MHKLIEKQLFDRELSDSTTTPYQVNSCGYSIDCNFVKFCGVLSWYHQGNFQVNLKWNWVTVAQVTAAKVSQVQSTYK